MRLAIDSARGKEKDCHTYMEIPRITVGTRWTEYWQYIVGVIDFQKAGGTLL